LEKGITFKYDDKALQKIADKSYGQKFGARDISKVIRKEVEDKISAIIIDNIDNNISGIALTANEELEVHTM
jgi:ATP-dependent Clp protease ATP-binding subunit ClpA